MSRRLVDKNWASRNIYLEKGDLLLLLEEPIKPLITARTRHGRNIRVPLSILSKECVEFNCQLCGHPSFNEYTSYTAHLIENHFRDQLMLGLDNTGRGVVPSCPFPVCSGTLWGSLEALLMHYASHHHVLEKLMMYESEKQCVIYRSSIKDYDNLIMELKEKIMRLEESELQKPVRMETVEKDTNTMPEVKGFFIKEEKEDDVKTLIKNETAAATSIENQTLKMEFLQLKLEKERIEKALESKSTELQTLKAEIKAMSKDQQNTVDMCKQWKEVCLAEETKHSKDFQTMKDELANHKREIENLKNIIEIGKSTVEHAKQLSTELAKDNKKRQLKELELEGQLLNHQQTIKCMELEIEKGVQEKDKISVQVEVQQRELSVKMGENSQLLRELKEMSSKYEASVELIKQKEQEIQIIKCCKVNEVNVERIQAEKLVVEVKYKKEIEKKNNQLKKAEESQVETSRELELKEIQLQRALEDFETEKAARQLDSDDYKASREHYEEQTNLLLTDLDTLKLELKQMKDAQVQEMGQRPTITELELDVRTKNNYINQLLSEVTAAKGQLERSDDLSDKLNNKIRQCEKMSAELKVQGWEIENYKNKLISLEMVVAEYGGVCVEKGNQILGQSSSMLAYSLSKQATTTAGQGPSIIDASSLRVGSNNNHELAAETEYQEISQDSLRAPSTDIKLEIVDIEEGKDITLEQREGNKRGSTTSNSDPDPKKQKQ